MPTPNPRRFQRQYEKSWAYVHDPDHFAEHLRARDLAHATIDAQLHAPASGPIADALHAAFARVLPALLDDPDELRARLTRRLRPLYQQPPRICCLALRAADSRIHDGDFRIVRHHTDHVFRNPPSPAQRRTRSTWKKHRTHRAESFGPLTVDDHYPHTLHLSAADLRYLCFPITFPNAPIDYQTAADLLGRHDGSLLPVLRKPAPPSPTAPDPSLPPSLLPGAGVFRVVPGPPRSTAHNRAARPLWIQPLNPARRFDPGSLSLSSKNPLLDQLTLSPHLLSLLPPDFETQLTRLPYRLNTTHPTRHSPSPTPGLNEFRGHRFLCPACASPHCKALYLPLHPHPSHFYPPYPAWEQKARHLLSPTDLHLFFPPPSPPPTHPSPTTHPTSDIPVPTSPTPPPHPTSHIPHPTSPTPPPLSFACGQCHRIRHASSHQPKPWDHLILHLSSALLYGREVPRPPLP